MVQIIDPVLHGIYQRLIIILLNKLLFIFYIIGIWPGPATALLSSLIFVNIHSVVKIVPATDAAFWIAVVVTLQGSINYYQKLDKVSL